MIKLIDIYRQVYMFDTFQVNSPITPRRAGVYAFLRDNNILYIGQTENFYNRLYLKLEQHQAWNCVSHNKVNSIAVHYVNGTEKQRIDIETYLRHNYSTPCNLQ